MGLSLRIFIGTSEKTEVTGITGSNAIIKEFNLTEVDKTASLASYIESNSELKNEFKSIFEATAKLSGNLTSKGLKLIFNTQYLIIPDFKSLQNGDNVFDIINETEVSKSNIFDFNQAIEKYGTDTIFIAPIYLRNYCTDETNDITTDSADTSSALYKYAKLVNFRTISGTSFHESYTAYTSDSLSVFCKTDDKSSGKSVDNNFWNDACQVILFTGQCLNIASCIDGTGNFKKVNYPLSLIKELGFDKSSGITYTINDFNLSPIRLTSTLSNGIQDATVVDSSNEADIYKNAISFTYFYVNPVYSATILYKPKDGKTYPKFGSSYTYTFSAGTALSDIDYSAYVCDDINTWIEDTLNGDRVGSDKYIDSIYYYDTVGTEHLVAGIELTKESTALTIINDENPESAITFEIRYTIPTTTYYNVDFLDNLDKNISSQKVASGESAKNPKDLYSVSGYTFIKWDSNAWSCVTQNLVIHALAAPEWDYLLSICCDSEKIDEIFSTETATTLFTEGQIIKIKRNLSNCCTGYKTQEPLVVGEGEDVVPFNPEGGYESDEAAADSIINIKNMEIIFKPKNFKEETRKYLEEKALAYIEEMIPSTTIFSYKFEGDEPDEILKDPYIGSDYDEELDVASGETSNSEETETSATTIETSGYTAETSGTTNDDTGSEKTGDDDINPGGGNSGDEETGESSIDDGEKEFSIYMAGENPDNIEEATLLSTIKTTSDEPIDYVISGTDLLHDYYVYSINDNTSINDYGTPEIYRDDLDLTWHFIMPENISGSYTVVIANNDIESDGNQYKIFVAKKDTTDLLYRLYPYVGTYNDEEIYEYDLESNDNSLISGTRFMISGNTEVSITSVSIYYTDMDTYSEFYEEIDETGFLSIGSTILKPDSDMTVTYSHNPEGIESLLTGEYTITGTIPNGYNIIIILNTEP